MPILTLTTSAFSCLGTPPLHGADKHHFATKRGARRKNLHTHDGSAALKELETDLGGLSVKTDIPTGRTVPP